MYAPQPAMLLRVYTEEGRQANGRPLYEDIVLKARKCGLAGATVLRGPMGFGHSQRLHTAKILDLSANLPMVIEIVDVEEKIRPFLDEMDGMNNIGLVTLENVEVIHYVTADDGRTANEAGAVAG
jgi:PII-like signaling protein